MLKFILILIIAIIAVAFGSSIPKTENNNGDLRIHKRK